MKRAFLSLLLATALTAVFSLPNLSAENEEIFSLKPGWHHENTKPTHELLGILDSGSLIVTDQTRREAFILDDRNNLAPLFKVSDRLESIGCLLLSGSAMLVTLVSDINGSRRGELHNLKEKTHTDFPLKEDFKPLCFTSKGKIILKGRASIAYSTITNNKPSPLTFCPGGAINAATDTLFWWDEKIQALFSKDLSTGEETTRKFPEGSKLKTMADGLRGELIALVIDVEGKKQYNPDVHLINKKLETVEKITEDTEFARFYEYLFHMENDSRYVLANSCFAEDFEIDKQHNIVSRKSKCFRSPVNGPFFSPIAGAAYVDTIGSLVLISPDGTEKIYEKFGAQYLKHSFFVSPDKSILIELRKSGTEAVIYDTTNGKKICSHSYDTPILRVGFNMKQECNPRYLFMLENGNLHTEEGLCILQSWLPKGRRLYPPLKYFDSRQPFFMYGNKILFATDQLNPTMLIVLDDTGKVSDSFEIDMGFWGVFGSNAVFRNGMEKKTGIFTIINLEEGWRKELKRELKFDCNQERENFTYKEERLIPYISENKLIVSAFDGNLKETTRGKVELPPTLGTLNEIGFVQPQGSETPLCVFRSNRTIYYCDFLRNGEPKVLCEFKEKYGDILTLTTLKNCILIRRRNGSFEAFKVVVEKEE